MGEGQVATGKQEAVYTFLSLGAASWADLSLVMAETIIGKPERRWPTQRTAGSKSGGRLMANHGAP